jgi:hypothetical protein
MPGAAIYGILIGGSLHGRWPSFRPTFVDYIVALLLVAYVISNVANGKVWSGFSVLGTMGLALAAPYFIVRSTFEQRSVQRQAVAVLIVVIAVISIFALIEMRLWPWYYANLLSDIGLAEPINNRPFRRFLFRATTSFLHPIDLGNSAALVFAAIIILARRSATPLARPWILAGLVAALLAWFAALSYSSYFGLAAGLCLYLILDRFGRARRLLVPGVLVVILVGCIFTVNLASAPLGERPANDAPPLELSYWVRHAIISRAWEGVKTAGLFGWGIHLDSVVEMQSVDNAYIGIAMRKGWVALGLWLALPIRVAAVASRGLRRARTRQQIQAILVSVSAVVGTMVAMFTVWFGFVYASLFMIVVALAVNAAQATGSVRARAPR